LQRSTDPNKDKEEHGKLGEAVRVISEMAQYIEQSKRTSDNFLRLAEIQKKMHGLREVGPAPSLRGGQTTLHT
jgi:hypothetical protein